jgi:CHAD domain-containing protein
MPFPQRRLNPSISPTDSPDDPFFLEPLLDKKRRKKLKNLKRLQKLFGALHDVVASQELLSPHRASLPRCANAEDALHSLEKEQRRRSRTSVL